MRKGFVALGGVMFQEKSKYNYCDCEEAQCACVYRLKKEMDEEYSFVSRELIEQLKKDKKSEGKLKVIVRWVKQLGDRLE
jgi:hypothetical protein